MSKMNKRVFDEYRELVHDTIGISLNEGKESLVEARVAKRMRALQLKSYEDYLKLLREDSAGAEMTHFMDAISTNVTSFFREPYHFDFLRGAVRGWRDAGQTRFRFWSSACSTGEEPFTMGMTLLDAMENTSDTRILATDISQTVLQRSSAGYYADKAVESVPEPFRRRFMARDGEGWRVRPELRAMVTFARLNLTEQPFVMKGPFDAIFCRNVMIYFDRELRARLVSEFHRLLRPGGYLLVGHAESLLGSDRQFRLVRPTIYQRI